MIEELKKVLSKAEKLTNDQQKELARLIENEIQWDDTLVDSQDELARLADEALREHQLGKTSDSDW